MRQNRKISLEKPRVTREWNTVHISAEFPVSTSEKLGCVSLLRTSFIILAARLANFPVCCNFDRIYVMFHFGGKIPTIILRDS